MRVEAPLNGTAAASRSRALRRARHLVVRFTESVRARRPTPDDLAFVRRVLTPDELACWELLGHADRAESLGVARRTAAGLGTEADLRWLAAALLHDVGKADARLGTVGRSVATVVAGVAGHDRVRGWAADSPSLRARVGRYVDHDERGARRLAAAGARPEVVAWAAAHHRGPDGWPAAVPARIAALLAAADGESELRPGISR